MLYFELSFRERKEKTLPKNFDAYVYNEMHERLWHKPTMIPPYFRDLMNPNDRNYMHMEDSDYVNMEDTSKVGVLDSSSFNPTLQVYAGAAASDAVDSSEYGDDSPQETEAFARRNKLVPTVTTGHAYSASTATLRAWQSESSFLPPTGPQFQMDLNSATPTSPPIVGARGSSHAVQGRAWNAIPPRPTLAVQRGRYGAHGLRSPVPSPTQSPGSAPSLLQQRHANTPCLATPTLGGANSLPIASSGPAPHGDKESDPHVLSSSDTSAGRSKRPTTGSIGVRRKSNAAIKVVADATLEGSDRLLVGLKEINNTMKEMKGLEMDLDFRIHEENMRYKIQQDQ
jgi:hypothetical protein